MKLIIAEKLEEYKASGVSELTEWQKGWNDAIDTIMNETPTVDAVPLEDYKSMEQTVNKLTKALADAEPTEEQVKEYCRKRCLVIVTSELFNEMKARWSAEPVRHGHWIEEIGMFLCSECGDSWGTETEEMVRSFNYCPNCGAKMRGDNDGNK